MSRSAAALIAAALLAALVLFAFLPTLGQGWAPIDDGLNFTRNEHYRGLAGRTCAGCGPPGSPATTSRCPG